MTSLSTRGQNMNLANPCLDRLVIAHELMHALGFHHEMNRPDRNQHIRINFQNIRPGELLFVWKIILVYP